MTHKPLKVEPAKTLFPSGCVVVQLTDNWKTLLFVKVYRYSERSSPPEVFVRKGVLRNFTKFTGTHLYQSLLFKYLARGHLARQRGNDKRAKFNESSSTNLAHRKQL